MAKWIIGALVIRNLITYKTTVVQQYSTNMLVNLFFRHPLYLCGVVYSYRDASGVDNTLQQPLSTSSCRIETLKGLIDHYYRLSSSR